MLGVISETPPQFKKSFTDIIASNTNTIMSGDNSTKVKVCIRCRPPSLQEARSRKVVSLQKGRLIVGEKSFIFDELFDDKCSQEDIYDSCVRQLVAGCLEGFNATVFAYGM